MTRSVELVFGLGGSEPSLCAILPIVVKECTGCPVCGDSVDGSGSCTPWPSCAASSPKKTDAAVQVSIMTSTLLQT